MIKRLTTRELTGRERKPSETLYNYRVALKKQTAKVKSKEGWITNQEVANNYSRTLAMYLVMVAQEQKDYFLDIIVLQYDHSVYKAYWFKEDQIRCLNRAMGDNIPTVEWLLSDDCLRRFREEQKREGTKKSIKQDNNVTTLERELQEAATAGFF